MHLCPHCHIDWHAEELVTAILLMSTELRRLECGGPVEQVPTIESAVTPERQWVKHDRGRSWTIIRTGTP